MRGTAWFLVVNSVLALDDWKPHGRDSKFAHEKSNTGFEFGTCAFLVRLCGNPEIHIELVANAGRTLASPPVFRANMFFISSFMCNNRFPANLTASAGFSATQLSVW